MCNIYGTREDTRTLLRPVIMSDAEFILSLRIDPAKSKYISKIEDDLEAQKKWLSDYLRRNREGVEYYFIVEDGNNVSLGTMRLYNINLQEKSATVGSWILIKGSPQITAPESMALIYQFAFDHLKLDTCYFEVVKDNRKVVKFHSCYATYLSSDEQFDYFKFQRKDFADSFLTSFLQ